jgi:hypothetical protein
MKVLRPLANAALAGLVLAALAVPAAAADGDPELSRGTPGCFNEPKFGLGANQGRCNIEVGFKPGTKLEKTWIKATFPYSIWVNGQRKVQEELTIRRTGKKDGDGFYRNSRLEELATFKLCDEIELRYFEASVTWENPDTGKDEVFLKIPGTTATERFPAGEDCSVSSDPQTTSATVASSQDPDDAGLLATSGSAEPGVLTAGGGVQAL